MKRFYKIITLSTLFVVVFAWSGVANIALAATTEMSSGSYKLEAISFGQDVVLYSTQDSILPAISSEGPQVSDIRATTATVTWVTDKSSSSVVSYGTTTGYGTQTGQFTEAVKNHTVYLAGLSQNTTYHFKVSSEDRTGNVGESTDYTFVTPKEPVVAALQITDVTLNSAIISFETSTVVHVVIEYGPTADYGSIVEEESGSYTTKHSIRLSGLMQGVTYYVRITGVDINGMRVVSDMYIFSTLPLPTISGLTVKEITPNTVVVYWKTNSETDSLVEYFTESDIEVSGYKKGDKITAGSAARSKEHSVKLMALLGNTTYYYKVFSQDEHSNRAESGQAIFTTQKDSTPPEITKVKTDTNLSDGGSGKVQITITWETNEPSTSQVSYGLGANESNNDKTTVEDTVYTTSHYAILQDMEPSSTYHIKVISRDPFNNIGTSKPYTILTPKKQRSLIQLLLDKLEETFGWLKKVGN